MAKTTTKKIKAIIEAYNSGVKNKSELGRKFKLSSTSISKILKKNMPVKEDEKMEELIEPKQKEVMPQSIREVIKLSLPEKPDNIRPRIENAENIIKEIQEFVIQTKNGMLSINNALQTINRSIITLEDNQKELVERLKSS